MSGPVSKRIVLQRLRNRIIESLELAASHDSQLEYQKSAPLIDVPAQVINLWEDFVGDDWRQHYTAGEVFTAREIDAIASFHPVWDEIAQQAPDLPLDALIHTPAWLRLAKSAMAALEVFLERGRLPED
jgi:hypothetical protein